MIYHSSTRAPFVFAGMLLAFSIDSSRSSICFDSRKLERCFLFDRFGSDKRKQVFYSRPIPTNNWDSIDRVNSVVVNNVMKQTLVFISLMCYKVSVDSTRKWPVLSKHLLSLQYFLASTEKSSNVNKCSVFI